VFLRFFGAREGTVKWILPAVLIMVITTVTFSQIPLSALFKHLFYNVMQSEPGIKIIYLLH